MTDNSTDHRNESRSSEDITGSSGDVYSLFDESVIPIVTGGDHNAVEVIGTAVLVEHNGLLYVVTAEHVITDWGAEYVLYLMIGEDLFEIKGPVWLSRGFDASADLAIISMLPFPELFALVWQRKAIPLLEYDGSIQCSHEYFLVYGYPTKRAKYDRNEKLLTINPLRYFTQEVTDDSLFVKYGIKNTTHLLVKYLPKDTKSHSGLAVTAPKPQGASGGPLFRALIDDEDRMVLVFEGIMTRWKDGKMITAARKSIIRDMIAHFHI
jgi:hypothetical protein